MILRLTDKAWAQKSFPVYEFCDTFQGLFLMGGEANVQLHIDSLVPLSTGAMKVLVSEATYEQL